MLSFVNSLPVGANLVFAHMKSGRLFSRINPARLGGFGDAGDADNVGGGA